MKKMKWTNRLLVIGLALMLAGSLLAHLVQTNFGSVELEDVSFKTEDNATLAGLLYIPEDASVENPKPAVICVHGGNSTRQQQSSFAIEFARHGYVVFAIDSSGNGWSSRKAAAENGNIAAINYVKSLNFVDKENIGVLGHSAGCAIFTTVVNNGIEGVKSAVLNGGAFAFAEGTDPASTPTNLCYVIGKYDENCGPTNWRCNGPRYAYTSEIPKQAFGISGDIEVGKMYGSAENNTLRVMYQPEEFHTWMVYSTGVVQQNLDFMALTMDGENDLSTSNQIFPLKELGTALSYIGMAISIFTGMAILLSAVWFAPVTTGNVEAQMTSTKGYWISVLLMSVAPIIAVQELYQVGQKLFSKIPLMNVSHLNGILFWQLATMLIILVINIILKNFTKGYDWKQERKMYAVGAKGIVRSFVLALVVVASVYLLVTILYGLFKTPVKLLQAEACLFTLERFKAYLMYVPFYIVYYLILGYVQMSGVDVKGGSARRLFLVTFIANALGIILFAIVFYGTVPIYGISLLHTRRFVGGVLVNFIPGIIISSGVQTYGYKKTGNIYTGAFINALLFAWLSVAAGALTTM